MRAAYLIITALGVASWLAELCVYGRPNWYCPILVPLTLLGLAILMVITAIEGIRKWRRTSRYWMLPTLICLAFGLVSWYCGPSAGRWIADWGFQRHLSQFTAAVDEIRNAPTLPVSPDYRELSSAEIKSLPDHIRAIMTGRCDNDSVIALFLLDTGVPLLHEGYVYKGYDENNPSIKCGMSLDEKLPYVRHLTGHWYHVSDQPGL